MGTVRLRVTFEDRHMLSRLQKSEGLKRSWILLDPQQQTISDISSYLIDAFQLDHTCPNGVILSMNGFVLPPFESVDILNDKDEISVKKKSCKLSNIIKASEDEGQLMILDNDIVDKQPLIAAIPLIANKEFLKEVGGYESDIKENDNEVVDVLPLEIPVKDETSKKRKAAKSVQSASKKRKKCKMITEESEINVIKEDNKVYENKIQLDTNVSKDENIPTTEKELICAQIPKDKPKKSDKNLEGNGVVTKKSDDIPASAQKVPSRSARRKKAKRIWRRELIKNEMERLKLTQNEEKSPQNDNQKNPITCQSLETVEQLKPTKCQSHQKYNNKKPIEFQSLETDEQMKPTECQSSQMDNHKNPIGFQSLETDEHLNPTESQSLEKVKQKNPIESHQPDHNTEGDDDIIPIVIRPGHIRFEPLGKDHPVPENQLPMETFQWNGITSKKQGQKWGKEKLPAKRVDSKDISNGSSGRAAKEKESLTEDGPINFEKLAPLLTLPLDGDVIAYRLVELSSSWTPEISSFRVGKTSRIDSQSNVILLTPVPEYPIVEKKANEEKVEEDVSEQPDNNSLYQEDGSLEIDFASLIDVRIIKPANQDPTESVEIAKPTTVVISDKKEVSPWDEMNEALRAKKKQLLEKSGWDTTTAGKTSWSYKALRGSALGPAMAYLRARNDI